MAAPPDPKVPDERDRRDGGADGDAEAPFELEPEAAPRPPSISPEDTAETTAAAAVPAVARVVTDVRTVSTATLRERQDPDSRSRPGPLAPPPDWPAEAWAYPWRAKGPFAAALLVAVGADLLLTANRFLGAMAWLLVTALHVQWQVRAVARSATGDDAAPRFFAFGLDPGALRWAGLFLISFVPALIALVIPYVRDLSHPVRSPGETVFLVVALAIPLGVLFPAAMLGSAFDDRALARPLGALRWFARGVGAFLSVPVAWAVVVAGHLVLPISTGSTLLVASLSVPLRALGVYAVLVSARRLGVLGRLYEP